VSPTNTDHTDDKLRHLASVAKVNLVVNSVPLLIMFGLSVAVLATGSEPVPRRREAVIFLWVVAVSYLCSRTMVSRADGWWRKLLSPLLFVVMLLAVVVGNVLISFGVGPAG
jgi:hypothetical protein